MILLRSLAFNLAFWGWTALMSIGCLPALLGPHRWATWVQGVWARGSIALARWVVGIRFEQYGRNHLPDGPMILAIKHQSSFETIAFSFLVDRPAIVLKKELISIPLYGWYALRAKMIAIDRKGSASAMRKMLRTAEEAIADGRPIVIFPEGTRTAAGGVGTYHPGVAGLYRHLKIPVVPVALDSGLYWPRRTVMKTPGTIKIQYLPAIEPGLSRADFMARLETEIEAATNVLMSEAGFRAVEKPVDNPGDSGD